MNVSCSLSPRLLALACGVLVLGCVRGDIEDWVVLHDGGVLEDDDRLDVGIGLTTRLAVAVESDVSGPLPSRFKPDGLQILPGAGVTVVEAGNACRTLDKEFEEQLVECSTGETTAVGGTLLDVTVAKEGDTEFSLLSDDIDEKARVLLEAHKVAGVRFQVSPRRSDTDAPRLFVGTVATIRPEFQGEGFLPGSTFSLPGTAPLELVSPASASTQLQGQRLTLGPTPGLYVVKSQVRPETVTLQTYDLAGIKFLGVKAPKSTRVGSLFTVEVMPQDGGRAPIAGKAPAPFAIASIGVPVQTFATRDESVVLEASAAGTVSLRVTWGSASADIQIEATP